EYDMTFDWVRTRARTRRHGWGFVRGEGRLDLHWHVLAESLGSRADAAFWADAAPLRTEGLDAPGAATLAPPDLLLHLLVHGVPGSNAPALQWVADAVHVVRARGAGSLAEPLARRARTHGEVARLRAAFEAIGTILEPAFIGPIVGALARTR